MRKPYIFEADNWPEPLDVIGADMTVFGAGDMSRPFEIHVEKNKMGGGPPPHRHPWDEAFYIVEGEAEVTLEGETVHLTAGAVIHIPGGRVHGFTVTSESSKFLAVVSDSKGGELFAALDKTGCVLPEDLDEFIAINQKFGAVFLDP